jgi:hypothetical protein
MVSKWNGLLIDELILQTPSIFSLEHKIKKVLPGASG